MEGDAVPDDFLPGDEVLPDGAVDLCPAFLEFRLSCAVSLDSSSCAQRVVTAAIHVFFMMDSAQDFGIPL